VAPSVRMRTLWQGIDIEWFIGAVNRNESFARRPGTRVRRRPRKGLQRVAIYRIYK